MCAAQRVVIAWLEAGGTGASLESSGLGESILGLGPMARPSARTGSSRAFNRWARLGPWHCSTKLFRRVPLRSSPLAALLACFRMLRRIFSCATCNYSFRVVALPPPAPSTLNHDLKLKARSESLRFKPGSQVGGASVNTRF